MVPVQVQGGTRVVPVKCLGKGGGSRVLNYCKCLCCPSGCSDRRASARAQAFPGAVGTLCSRECLPSRKSGGPSHPKPTPERQRGPRRVSTELRVGCRALARSAGRQCSLS